MTESIEATAPNQAALCAGSAREAIIFAFQEGAHSLAEYVCEELVSLDALEQKVAALDCLVSAIKHANEAALHAGDWDDADGVEGWE